MSNNAMIPHVYYHSHHTRRFGIAKRFNKHKLTTKYQIFINIKFYFDVW